MRLIFFGSTQLECLGLRVITTLARPDASEFPGSISKRHCLAWHPQTLTVWLKVRNQSIYLIMNELGLEEKRRIHDWNRTCWNLTCNSRAKEALAGELRGSRQ